MSESGKGADGGRHTDMAQSAGSKQIKVVSAQRQTATDIHKAPPSRLHTNDYSKVTPEKDDKDIVGPLLGDIVGW